MSSDESENQARLKEFESLRHELLALTNRVNVWLQVTWAGIVTLMGASVIAESSYPALIGAILAMANWWEGIRQSHGASKIGSYIEIIIEPKVPGLGWEGSIHDRLKERPLPVALLTRRHFPQMIAYLVSLVSLSALYYMYPPDRYAEAGMLIAIAFSVFLGFCLFRYDYISSSDRDYYRKEFLRLNDKDCNK